MFVETKREGETPAMAPQKQRPSLRGFIAWLATQEPAREYIFCNAGQCAAGLYYKSIGLSPNQWIMGPFCSVAKDIGMDGDYRLMAALSDEPRTFGAAFERMRKLSG